MSGMLKAGLIGLVVGGIFGLGVTAFVSPCCTPCAAIVVGLGVGFLACLWDKPISDSSGAGLGAKAGAIAGVGYLGGQLLGMVVTGVLVGPEGAAEFAAFLGLETAAIEPAQYWMWQALINGGCGITNIVVAAGLGALGGLLWFQTMGKNQTPLDQPTF
jgi:hypothetical protein